MFEHLGFLEGLQARIEGPLSLRLVIQPAIALFFSVRDGLQDARTQQPPFFWAIFSDPNHRKELLSNGWQSIGKVFLIALILDGIFQYLTFGLIRPIGAFVAAVVLALIPYLLLRGPINRLIASRK